jgi:prepilin-type N-terminal cleavage/methylation domain-containing protein
MCRQNRTGRGGFSLIEVIVSMALLAMIVPGFFAASAVGGKALLLGYREEAAGMKGKAREEDSPTGKSLTVYFTVEEDGEAEEIFDEYSGDDESGDGVTAVKYYRHR